MYGTYTNKYYVLRSAPRIVGLRKNVFNVVIVDLASFSTPSRNENTINKVGYI